MYKFPKDPGQNLINKGLWALRCMILSIHILVKNMQKKHGGKNMYKIGKAQSKQLNHTLSASPVQKSWDAEMIVCIEVSCGKKHIYVPWHWICIDSWFGLQTGPCSSCSSNLSPWNPVMICLEPNSREAGHQRNIENESGQSALLQDFFGSS